MKKRWGEVVTPNLDVVSNTVSWNVESVPQQNTSVRFTFSDFENVDGITWDINNMNGFPVDTDNQKLYFRKTWCRY